MLRHISYFYSIGCTIVNLVTAIGCVHIAESVGSRRELVANSCTHRRRRRDATRQNSFVASAVYIGLYGNRLSSYHRPILAANSYRVVDESTTLTTPSRRYESYVSTTRERYGERGTTLRHIHTLNGRCIYIRYPWTDECTTNPVPCSPHDKTPSTRLNFGRHSIVLRSTV